VDAGGAAERVLLNLARFVVILRRTIALRRRSRVSNTR
jgi:hypothetical protein